MRTIKIYRKLRRITQVEMADKLMIAQSTLHNIESGKREMRLPTLARVKHFYPDLFEQIIDELMIQTGK